MNLFITLKSCMSIFSCTIKITQVCEKLTNGEYLKIYIKIKTIEKVVFYVTLFIKYIIKR